MNWRELKKKGLTVVGGAVSGGLDSCTATHWLRSKGFKVYCFTVDLGQPDEENLNSIVERMTSCGASDAFILSGQEALARAGLNVIQAQARYEGGYWNTTGIARPVTVKTILPELQNRKIPVFFHGSTGRGNDQVRFQLAVNMLEPELEVYAPWRDPEFIEDFPGRKEMIEYCKSNNLPIKPTDDARYSTDANFLGLTHEAGDLENVSIPPFFITPGMGSWPWNAIDQPQTIGISWRKGIPISIDGRSCDLVEIINEANQIAGQHGIGIGTHVLENRFVGTKSRGIYESPGMELLGRTYEYLIQFILDRRARIFYTQLSSLISEQIYQGYWLDPTTNYALSALNAITQLVTGDIFVRLYKGGIYFEKSDNTQEVIPHSLYTDDSSMESLGTYNHSDSEGFLKVLGVSAKNVGRKQNESLNQ